MTINNSRKTFHLRQNAMLQQLRNEILSGIKAIGEYLPSEKMLSEQFGLSNKAVRQVLEVLANEQLIEKKARIGNRVVSQGQKRITLKLGHHETTPNESGLSDLLSAFQQEYPYIQVQAITLPSYSPDVLKSYMDYGMMDVMTFNDSEFQEFIETGNEIYLAPVEKKSDMYPFLSKAFMSGEQLLAQPFVFSPAILCYNRDHFTEKGLSEPDNSWSWEQVFETGRKLDAANERIGFLFSVSQRNRFSLFLLQSGVVFERRPNGQIQLFDTKMMEAIRFYKDIISNRMTNILSKQDASFRAEDLFVQGKVSMIITTYLSLNHIRKANIQYELAPLPHRESSVTHLITLGLAVNKQSPHLEAAQQLVDFLSSYEAQLAIRKNTLSLPSLKTAAEWMGEECGYRPSRFPMYREWTSTFRYHKELGITEKEWKIFFDEIFMYLLGLETEEMLCSRLEGFI